MERTTEKKAAVRVRDRTGVSKEELKRGMMGLLRVSVDVLRSAGRVEVVDQRWIDTTVEFRGDRR